MHDLGVELSPEYASIGLDRVRYHVGRRQLTMFAEEFADA